MTSPQYSVKQKFLAAVIGITFSLASAAMPTPAARSTTDAQSEEPHHKEPTNPPKSPVIDLDAPIVDIIGDVEFRHCKIKGQERVRKLQCAWVNVPVDPDNANSPQLPVFVARIAAKRKAKINQDPMLFIAGGPGQAASETFLFADHQWPTLARKRDFYLIDQRGTGYSNNLNCDNPHSIFTSGGQTFDSEKIANFTKNCLKSLPDNVQLYTTDNTIRDFETVRTQLGVQQWNLLGVSYGTRVATHYMRRAAKGLRTVVLDSVVPPKHILGLEISAKSQEALDTLLHRCKTDPSCNKHVPNLGEKLADLFLKLKASPMAITIENFTTGKLEDIEFTRQHLQTLIRMYLYNSATAALLPPMLQQAIKDQNYAPLARAALAIQDSLSSSISVGLHNSVMCTEEFPFYPSHKNNNYPGAGTYLGMEMVKSIEVICKNWPRGKVLNSMKTPLVSSVPALLLSGEFDPITPPSYAEQTLKHLKNAKHIELKGQGHFVSGAGCMPNIIDNFVNARSVEHLKIDCLARLSAAPLFFNFNATAP